MRIVFACLVSVLMMLSFTGHLSAQQSQVTPAASDTAASPVPHLIRFTGTLLDRQGQPLKGPVGVTFSLYSQQSGDAPLWMETQNVELDAKGGYTVLLGANSATDLPEALFRNGEARWLGVQPEREPELPRVLLVSVPYALKAGDAQTLGGLPPSAFAPASSVASSSASPSSAAPLTLLSPSLAAGAAPGTKGANSAGPLVTACTTITADGTATLNQVAEFTASCKIHQSQLFDNGTNVGISNGSTAPAAKLDVFGTGMFRGALTLPAINTANATTKGFNSQPFDFLASVFNSTAAVSQHFRWQAEPVNPGLTTASAKLNLLFASGTGTPAETGLSISNKGIITAHQVGVGTATPAAELDVFSSTAGIHAGIAQFGSKSLTDSNSILVYNGSGITEMFQAGFASAFVLGAQPGDGGLRVAPGKSILFGDSGNARMTIDGNGHVAIGNATTFLPLHVVSSFGSVAARFEGSVSVSGGISVNSGILASNTIETFGDLEASGCVIAGSTTLGGPCVSDARLKKNIQHFSLVLDKLVQLQPVSYNWRADEYPQFHFGSSRTSGLIAQEVEKVFPEMVSVDKDGFNRVNYGELPLLMLQAIRELKAEKDKLQEEMKTKEAQWEERFRAQEERASLQQVQQQVAALEARLARVESEGGSNQTSANSQGPKEK